MSEPLFSASWYRAAGLRPRLRPQAEIHRHVYRGQVWYVIQDHASGRFHRFNPATNLIIGLMDGAHTLQEIWNAACASLGDEVPTQDEILKLVSMLHKADLLQTDETPDIVELHERRRRLRGVRLRQYFLNPLALRFPLLDPDRALGLLLPLARPLFGWLGVVLWLTVVGFGTLIAAQHWQGLSTGVADRMLTLENLFLVWLIYPVVKLLHEFGHGLAVKAWGGEVHEMGVMLLVLAPIPYVDASATTAFHEKRRRVIVGAAGMLVELFLAALALIVWANVEPGALRAVAYNVIFIAGVSTLLFNGNPLLRYDGYYILSDLLEIPNLGQRANEYLGYLIQRYAFGNRELPSPVTARGERGWLFAYAATSFSYRVFVLAAIVLFVAEKYFIVGVLLALWGAFAMFILPLWKKLGFLLVGPALGKHRARAVAVTGLALATVLVIAIWVPAPSWTRTEGVVWAPERAQVRAGTACFISAVLARHEQQVRQGDPLLACEDPEINADVRRLEAQLRELLARSTAYLVTDRLQADLVREELVHVEARLAEARRRMRDLVILSPQHGRFVMPEPNDAIGRYVFRGELLAYVLEDGDTTVRMVVEQADVDLVRNATVRVEVRPADRISEVIAARLAREVPGATDQLPSAALSLEGGGRIGIDPNKTTDELARGEAAVAARALVPLFVFDLEIAAEAGIRTLGNRVYVRIEHRPEPLGRQMYRGARRVLLHKFDV